MNTNPTVNEIVAALESLNGSRTNIATTLAFLFAKVLAIHNETNRALTTRIATLENEMANMRAVASCDGALFATIHRRLASIENVNEIDDDGSWYGGDAA